MYYLNSQKLKKLALAVTSGNGFKNLKYRYSNENSH